MGGRRRPGLSIELCGYRIGRVDGLPVEHVGEASVPPGSELHRIKGEDMARLEHKYGKYGRT